MKIAITSEGQSLEAAIDPRFGRCKYFLIMDTDTGNFEAVENSHAQNSGGAGIQAGQLVVSKGVEAVLTGNMGPNAFRLFNQRGSRSLPEFQERSRRSLKDIKAENSRRQKVQALARNQGSPRPNNSSI
jgi:predicted Fe-Mo cluster-binding NifX family protein